MPKLPTDADLGLVAADASGRLASVSNAGAAGEATAQLGANVVQLGSTILDVHDENAQAAADSAVWRGKIALDQKYKNDPDPATAPQRYNDELTNLVGNAAGGIIQPRIKTQFMDMANRYVVARGVEMIQNQSDTALTNQAVAKLSDDGDAGVTAFAHTTDPRDQFGITQSYYGQVDAMVKARTLDATVGEKLKKDFIHRAIYSNIANAGSPDEMIKRWNGFNGVETPDAAPAAGASPAPTPATGGDAYKTAIIKGESGGNVAAVNPKTGAAGRYQMLPSTAAQYGLTPADLTNPDPKVQAKVDVAFQKFTDDNRATLTKDLGHAPTDAELTLAHQQGATGAANLLLNPDNSLAVNVVGRDAVLGNGGTVDMTSGQFADHVMGYYGASGTSTTGAPANENTPAEPTMTNEPAPGSMASKVPADVYDTMFNGIQGELNRVQAQVDHKQAVADKLRTQAADTAMTGYQQQMIAHAADPTQPDVDMVKASQDPRLAGDKTALPALLAFQKQLDHPMDDKTLDQKNMRDLYGKWLDGKATDKDFDKAFIDGDISKESRTWLGTQTTKATKPEDESAKALKKNFLDNETSMVGLGLSKDELVKTFPEASQLIADSEYRLIVDLNGAWDAKVKAGEDPTSLVTPGSKDYFGSQANMSKYIKTADQWLAEAQKAHDAANPPQPGFFSRAASAIGDLLTPTAPATGFSSSAPAVPAAPKVYKSAADLQAAINSGEISLPDAQAYGMAHGILKPKGPAAPAPVTAAGLPTVPSGE